MTEAYPLKWPLGRERTPAHARKYARCTVAGFTAEVEKVRSPDKHGLWFYIEGGIGYRCWSCYTPATEAEYLAYQQSKNTTP